MIEPTGPCGGRNVIEQVIEAMITQARGQCGPLAKTLLQILVEEGLQFAIGVLRRGRFQYAQQGHQADQYRCFGSVHRCS